MIEEYPSTDNDEFLSNITDDSYKSFPVIVFDISKYYNKYRDTLLNYDSKCMEAIILDSFIYVLQCCIMEEYFISSLSELRDYVDNFLSNRYYKTDNENNISVETSIIIAGAFIEQDVRSISIITDAIEEMLSEFDMRYGKKFKYIPVNLQGSILTNYNRYIEDGTLTMGILGEYVKDE